MHISCYHYPLPAGCGSVGDQLNNRIHMVISVLYSLSDQIDSQGPPLLPNLKTRKKQTIVKFKTSVLLLFKGTFGCLALPFAWLGIKTQRLVGLLPASCAFQNSVTSTSKPKLLSAVSKPSFAEQGEVS